MCPPIKEAAGFIKVDSEMRPGRHPVCLSPWKGALRVCKVGKAHLPFPSDPSLDLSCSVCVSSTFLEMSSDKLWYP